MHIHIFTHTHKITAQTYANFWQRTANEMEAAEEEKNLIHASFLHGDFVDGYRLNIISVLFTHIIFIVCVHSDPFKMRG